MYESVSVCVSKCVCVYIDVCVSIRVILHDLFQWFRSPFLTVRVLLPRSLNVF